MKKTIFSCFLRQVYTRPHHIAISCDGRNYTYLELGAIIEKISNDIKTKHLGHKAVIGVLCPRSELNIIIALSSMACDCIYVPLDESLPKERIKIICEQANINCLMGEKTCIESKIDNIHLNKLSTLFYSVNTLKNFCSPIVLLQDNVSNTNTAAVVVFTSGSTGIPKGVIHSHHCLFMCNVIDAKHLKLSSKDNFLAILNFSYAFSLQVFLPLTIGSTLHIATDRIRTNLTLLNKYIEDNAISVTTMPTQLGHLFISTQVNNSLKLLIVGGGVLPKLSFLPNYKLISNYGCSESIFAAYRFFNKNNNYSLLGTANSYVQFKVIDENGNDVPIGKTGELWISSPTTALGYVNSIELTKQKFILLNGKKWCRTGDEVRKMPSNQLQFIGRLDGMVKLRNQRIELTEIEFWISTIKDIKQTCVCIKNVNCTPHICAFYESYDNNEVQIKNELAKHLPKYMIPTYFIKVDHLPINSNGKFDKNALEIPPKKELDTYIAKTEKEIIVSNAIAKLLSINETINMNDNFSSLGGDSLDALRLSMIIGDEGFSISMNSIIKSKSLKDLATSIKDLRHSTIKKTHILSNEYCDCPPIILNMISHNSIESINGFVIPEFFKCIQRIRINHIHNVICALTNVHDMLRACIKDDKYFIQDPLNHSTFILKEYTIHDIPSKSNSQVNELIQKLYSAIDIFNGPSLAIFLLHCTDTDYILSACSHVISDSISKEIFKRDFITALSLEMQGKPIKLEKKSSNYSEYIRFTTQYNKYFLSSNKCSYSFKETCNYKEQYIFIEGSLIKKYEMSHWAINEIEISSYILTSIIFSLQETTNQQIDSFLIFKHGRDFPNNKLSFVNTIGFFPTCYTINTNSKYVKFNECVKYINKHIHESRTNEYFANPNKTSNIPLFSFDNLGEYREYIDTNEYIEPALNISKGNYNQKNLFMGTYLTFFMRKKSNQIYLQIRYDANKYSSFCIDSFIRFFMNSFQNNLSTIIDPKI